MLAAIEDVIIELLVVYVRERECEHSLYGDIERRAVARQLQVAQALTIAHCLRSTLLLKHAVYGCGVSAEHLAALTVDVVRPRTLGVILHILHTRSELHGYADTTSVYRRVLECHLHVHHSVRIDGIYDGVCVLAVAHCGLHNNVLALLCRSLYEMLLTRDSTFFLVLVLSYTTGSAE